MKYRWFLLFCLLPLQVPAQNEAQRAFMDLKYGMFIHFGINTFYDKEWSYGELPLAGFQTDSVDTDQWCRVARDAGMKYVIFTTKHVDGFCNWHTRQTPYSIQHTPYGKDVVRLLSASCKKYRLQLGLYYCLWDAHNPDHGKNQMAYNAFVRSQITELLTDYGDIACLWFDGFWKNQKSGWTKKGGSIEGEKVEAGPAARDRDEKFIDAWRREGAWKLEWDQLYNLIKRLQPRCIVFNNPTTAYHGVPLLPVDARPAEKGHTLTEDRKFWNWAGDSVYLPLQIETTLSQKGDKLFPSGNWFWHEWDHSVATREQVEAWVAGARRLQANLVLNVGPMRNGKLRPEDLELLGKIRLR